MIFRSYAARSLMIGAATLALATPAWAQDTAPAQPAAAQPAPDEGREIVVTGTRRLDRSITDSASPVDVVSSQDLQAAPTANMLDTLKNIVPSFFVGQNTISDASTFVRPPSLRGLPPDEVLVMLNGKRFNRSALVQVFSGGESGLAFGSHGSDISSIPSIAIKNLQILREGATAQYGSDAIAGVLNYGLRDDAGYELIGRYGQFYEGDGEGKQIAGNLGVKLGEGGFINLSGEWFDDNQTSRGETRPTAVVFAEENPDLADQLPHFPLPAQIWGQSPTHGYKFMLNTGYEASEKATIYLFGNLAHTEADQSFNFRSSLVGVHDIGDRDNGINIAPATGIGREFFQHPYYQTPCPAANPTCPAGAFVLDGNTFNLSSIYPGGFTPRFVGVTDQIFGAVGVRGSFDSGFRYDISGSLARNKLDLSMYNSISPSFGPESQTEFQFGKQIQKEANLNLDVAYEMQAGLASPITFSAGAELRKETYKTTPGDEQSFGVGPWANQAIYRQIAPGVFTPVLRTDPECVTVGTVMGDPVNCVYIEAPAASGYGGTSPTFAGSNSEESWGIYGGAEADVTEQLTLGAAVRHEHYESSGGTTVFKINGKYDFSDAFAVRATVGTGFHAPSPGQNNAQVLTTNFISGVSVQTGTFPVTSEIAQFYGATSLGPAKATNYGLGFVVTPMSNLTLTLDLYRIKVRDRIFISAPFAVTQADIDILPALASVGVGGVVQYFTNSFDTRTSGVDFVGTYRTDLFDGNLDLTLAYNYNKTKVTDFVVGQITQAQITDAERLAPHHRANLQASWRQGPFAINAAEHFYGSWRSEVDYPGQKFGSKFTTDIEASYTFMEHFTVSVGANNLFDQYPDKIAASTANPIFLLTDSLGDGQVYPRNGGPFGINGGFWYTRLRIKY
ncbi:TonB-dependent receptor [Sphingomonas sp. RB56-2]|uniref:TonB-dependent receptor n=1 Tax=Sphingomonas brevis TaxID=2908206 RepID=A0ABT0S690_9SPHN|nr:TonB-dependent receptor [Sphingomonas brevis]MCL6739891.1 TonB-dependent receptor [Sphingomonas brevis]